MDIRAVLKARGLDDAKVETLMTDPAYSSILEGFINEAESGKTAMLKAQQIETDLKKWNDETLIPTYTKKDMEYADTSAKLAAAKEVLKTLKAQGYEIPAGYIDDSTATPPPPAKPAGIDASYVDQKANDIARVNMALMSVNEKARDLLGHGLDFEAEYEDFGKNRRPNENVREYVARKYDLGTLETKREAEKKQKYEDGIRSDAAKAAIADYEQKHGSNGETRVPRSSTHDRFREISAERKDSWNTVAGREASTAARQEKYAELLSKRQTGSVQ